MSVAELLARRAGESPSAIFVVFEDEDGSTTHLTYAEMWDRARRTATWLGTVGVRRGGRVHLHMPNRLEFFDLWFGCAVAGAVMVPTNPLLTSAELSYEIEHSGASVTVTTADLVSVAIDAGAATVVDLETFAGARDGADPADAVSSDDPLAVLYTSGTTSRPKGVVITHANYLHVGRVVAEHLEMTSSDRWLVVLPLFHANAQYYSTMSALSVGGSVAVMGRFSASRWGRQVAEHETTLASLFAAPIRMILAQDGDAPPNRLRAVTYSQNITSQERDRFEERFDVRLFQLYGMTETIAPPTIEPLDQERRPLSIGRARTGAKIRLIDEDGSDVGDGVPGQMLIAGEPGQTVMAGYLDDPDATAATLRDGWLHTGDMAKRDGDGYFYFVDRVKDMIKRAGENVSAGEIEAVAIEHPAIAECAAVGVPDEMRDEAIVLVCVAAAGAAPTGAEVIEWCAERLARFKVPSLVRFVERLPRTSVGKVQKEKLRRELIAHKGG